MWYVISGTASHSLDSFHLVDKKATLTIGDNFRTISSPRDKQGGNRKDQELDLYFPN